MFRENVTIIEWIGLIEINIEDEWVKALDNNINEEWVIIDEYIIRR